MLGSRVAWKLKLKINLSWFSARAFWIKVGRSVESVHGRRCWYSHYKCNPHPLDVLARDQDPLPWLCTLFFLKASSQHRGSFRGVSQHRSTSQCRWSQLDLTFLAWKRLGNSTKAGSQDSCYRSSLKSTWGLPNQCFISKKSITIHPTNSNKYDLCSKWMQFVLPQTLLHLPIPILAQYLWSSSESPLEQYFSPWRDWFYFPALEEATWAAGSFPFQT